MSVAHPDPDRLALAALPAEPPDPELAAHLADCAPCRDRVAQLRRTVQLARSGQATAAETGGPPPRVWQAIADELTDAGELPAAGNADVPPPAAPAGNADVPPPAPPAGSAPDAPPPPRAARRRRLGVPVAAGLAGLAAGVAIGVALPTPVPPPAPRPSLTLLARLQPVGTADPGAAGTVDGDARDGRQQLVIRIEGVTDTAGGDYLEAWLLDPAGTRLVSLGALTRTADGSGYQGEFTVPANLPMATYNTVDISAERWDGDPTHSRISLLRGHMA